MTLEDLFDAIAAAPLAPLYPSRSRALAVDLEARRHTSGRACTIPGGTTTVAGPTLYIEPGRLFPIPRWLDVCWLHYSAITDMMTWTPDEQMLDRYAAWVVDRALARLASWAAR